MSGKKILRKLTIGFGILMLFLVIDIAVAWYLNPKAQTPVQAVRMEAAQAAAKIIAKTMKAQLKKKEEAAPAAPAPEQPVPQPDQQQAQPEQPQQQSDTGTHLEDIEAEDNILVYTITVQANGEQFDFVMRNLHSNLFPSGCTRPEYERLLEYGLGVTLDFRSMDNLKRDSITFTPEVCGYTRIEQSPQQPAPAPQPPTQQPQQPAPVEQPQQPEQQTQPPPQTEQQPQQPQQ